MQRVDIPKRTFARHRLSDPRRVLEDVAEGVAKRTRLGVVEGCKRVGRDGGPPGLSDLFVMCVRL